MKLIRLLVVIAMSVFLACNKDDGAMPSAVDLSLENQSGYTLESVISNEIRFGTLQHEDITTFVRSNEIHAWPDVSAVINNEEYIWTSSIDNLHFWAQKFDSGRYKIIIRSVDHNARTIDAELQSVH